MSLTAFCIIATVTILEFTLWFYASHNSEQPRDRAVNLLGTTCAIAALAVCYLSGWSLMDRTRFIDLTPAFWIASINGVIAIVIASLLVITRPHRQHG